MSRAEPTRRAAEAVSDDDAAATPLGRVRVGENNGSLTVTLRKEVAEQLGIEPGDEMEVWHEPVANEFRFRPAEEFEGW
jgi:hypothetical protein